MEEDGIGMCILELKAAGEIVQLPHWGIAPGQDDHDRVWDGAMEAGWWRRFYNTKVTSMDLICGSSVAVEEAMVRK